MSRPVALAHVFWFASVLCGALPGCGRIEQGIGATGGAGDIAVAAGGNAGAGAAATGGEASGGTSTNPGGGGSPVATRKMPNPSNTGLPNPASYTDLGDGAVLDNVTGLVWQRDVPSGGYTWQEAKDYCASLSLGGRGWRLPTRIELVSLVDFTKADPGPTIDTTAFPNAPSNWFWSSSLWDGPAPAAWYVNFLYGNTRYAEMDNPYQVRCVEGSTADATPGRYVVAAGEVQDTQTGLVWQQADCGAPGLAWSDAQSYCATLGLNGRSWRVPSIRELPTLLDESKSYPAIDTNAFPSAASEGYWSSSLKAGTSSSMAWYTHFADGSTAHCEVTYEHRVRCVR